MPLEIPTPSGTMGMIFKYFWVVFIVFTFINARQAWNRSVKPRIEERPELEEGYRALYRNSLVWLNVPWALMGVGILSGRVDQVHQYLMPSAGNPAVILWWGAMALLAVAGTFWVFNGGAERLAEYPGLMSLPPIDAKRLKMIWVGGCVWNLLCAVLLFNGFPFAMEGAGFVELIPAFFPVFFVALWVFIGFILGQVSGWAGLADAFPQVPEYSGPLVSTSGRMGLANYNGVLRFGADGRALHLGVMIFFRIGHPPLSIPWSEIRVSKRKGFFVDYVVFDMKQVKLEMPRWALKRLAKRQTLPGPLGSILREGS